VNGFASAVGHLESKVFALASASNALGKLVSDPTFHEHAAAADAVTARPWK
jgi:hypothetical protein